MEVHFSADARAKMDQMALDSGRPSEELLDDAAIGYLDEMEQALEMHDRRYDDLKSGKVKTIDGEGAFRRLIAETDAGRHRLARSMIHRPGPQL